jgi:hypothetical protein
MNSNAPTNSVSSPIDVPMPELQRNSNKRRKQNILPPPPGFDPISILTPDFAITRTEYIVDDAPLPDAGNGVLQLKMPIPRENALSLNTMQFDSPVKKTQFSVFRAPPVREGESIHMGYIPLTEEMAFENPVSIDRLSPSRFVIPRGRFQVSEIIDRIRTIVFYTHELNEIVPKNTSLCFKLTHKCLYATTLLYSSTRFAQMRVQLHAVKSPESIAVEVLHSQGDTRVCMAVLKTIRDFVVSEGTSSHRVVLPNLNGGSADEFYLTMHDANK